jgi:hypothetical protein
VRGIKETPNRWKIPPKIHDALHQGKGGRGAPYNEFSRKQIGEISHEVLGGERSETEVNPETFEVTSRRIPRAKGGGLFVGANLVQKHAFFRANQCPIWNLCADAVRVIASQAQLTSVPTTLQ